MPAWPGLYVGLPLCSLDRNNVISLVHFTIEKYIFHPDVGEIHLHTLCKTSFVPTKMPKLVIWAKNNRTYL